MSQLFVRTLREDPADAEVPSHTWLVRAGYIRRAAPGIYSWLPLGLKVLQNVERIVREEMDAIGGQEVRFPALLPREPYDASGRWTDYGPNIFRLKDRKGADYLLGPTHEEMFTLLVKDLYSSYKDLPLTLYQIQTKYRDEPRPRAGILRGREFVMKDSYTFDIDVAVVPRAVRRAPGGVHPDLRPARLRVRRRLRDVGRHGRLGERGVPGAVGDRRGHVRALARRVRGQRRGRPDAHARTTVPFDDVPAAHVEDTPDTPTIASLVAVANERYPRDDRPWTGADTLKNVVLMVTQPDGKQAPLVLGLPGDREVDLKRVAGAARAGRGRGVRRLRRRTRCWSRATSARRSSARSRAAGSATSSTPASAWAPAGSPAPTSTASTSSTWSAGATSPRTGSSRRPSCARATPRRTVPVRWSWPAASRWATSSSSTRSSPTRSGCKVLDQNGKLVTVTMGSYGLGCSRAVAAVADNTCDDKGLAWPRELAPYLVHVVVAGKDAAALAWATELATSLDEAGVTVLLDDRKASPGVKFADAEILGMPTIVVVGRGFADGHGRGARPAQRRAPRGGRGRRPRRGRRARRTAGPTSRSRSAADGGCRPEPERREHLVEQCSEALAQRRRQRGRDRRRGVRWG